MTILVMRSSSISDFTAFFFGSSIIVCIFATEIPLLFTLNSNAYEKEKSRKMCKIGQNAW